MEDGGTRNFHSAGSSPLSQQNSRQIQKWAKFKCADNCKKYKECSLIALQQTVYYRLVMWGFWRAFSVTLWKKCLTVCRNHVGCYFICGKSVWHIALLFFSTGTWGHITYVRLLVWIIFHISCSTWKWLICWPTRKTHIPDGLLKVTWILMKTQEGARPFELIQFGNMIGWGIAPLSTWLGVTD